MNKIKGFCDCLQPYFQIIEIVCQSHPEWSCIAWGAFRLVLQLATNFVTFFEKLSKLIKELTMRLPQYTDYYELLCSGHNTFSPRLSESLMNFYVDMFNFFQAVARVFSRPSGKLRRTPIVIADLLWRPFETRFQDILERMNFHQIVLKDELNLAFTQVLQSKLDADQKRAGDALLEAKRHAKLSEEIMKVQTDTAQRIFRAAVIAWLAPPSFKDSLEYAEDVREEDTAEWLFADSRFMMWMSSPGTTAPERGNSSDTILWVQGNPGWGKTVLAASTIEELQSSPTSSGSNSTVCYYFFHQQDPAKALSARLAAYRAIAAQIFHQCHKMEEVYNIYALANDGSNSTASEHELRDLLGMIIPLLSNVFLVLDGLDELNDVEKFMSDVRGFCKSSSAKVLLFSRPHVASLRDMLLPEQTITMSRPVMNLDIRIFVQHKILDLSDQNEIVKQADGIFLWARLMICYLSSPALTRSQRISTIFSTTPVGLQDMYDRILSQITLMDDASQQLATSTFTWMAYAQHDLTAEECSDAVYCATGQDDSSEKKDFVDKAVIVVCCGLIEKRQNNTLQFIHLTAKEHLLSLVSRGKNTLILSSLESHIKIASRCLSYLLFSLPSQPLSGRLSVPADPVPLRHEYHLLPYSAKHWPKHLGSVIGLCKGTTNQEEREGLTRLFELINKFLAHPINVTVWVEAAFLFDGGNSLPMVCEISDAFRDLFDACPDLDDYSSTAKTFALLSNDLQLVEKYWSKILTTSPHEIWGDVSSFTNSQFIAQSRGIDIRTFAPSRENHPEKRTEPLFCIGSKNSDCTLIGKLTIYPSRAFEDLWKKGPRECDPCWFESFRDDDHLQKYCKEWLARYDIHEIGDNSETLSTTYIPLSAQDISLQMQFSFRRSPLAIWKLKFPMAIYPDLSTIVVLRTIITADLSSPRQDKSNKVFTHVPDFGHHERLRRSWSKTAFSPAVPALPYLYDWSFTSDSSYAIFRDWDMTTCYGSLAVLSLSRSRLGVKSEIIEYRGLEREQGLRLCTVHPSEPKMIMLDHDKLVFKDFTTGKEYYSNSPSTCAQITKLEYSQCGRYYILYLEDGSRPHIYPLPWDSSDPDPSKRASNSGTHFAKKRTLEQVTKDSFEMMLSGSEGLLNTVGSSSSIMDPQANLVLSISSGTSGGLESSQRIQLTRHDTGHERKSSCTLVTMPGDADPQSITTTLVQLDRKDAKRVRLVLTPEAQSTYESDTHTVSRHLPAVIDRDTATLFLHPTQRQDSQAPIFPSSLEN